MTKIHLLVLVILVATLGCKKNDSQYYWVYEYRDYSLTGQVYNIERDTVLFEKVNDKWLIGAGFYSKSGKRINYYDEINGALNPHYRWGNCPANYEWVIAFPASNDDSSLTRFKLQMVVGCESVIIPTLAGEFKCRVYQSEAVRNEASQITYGKREDFYNPEIGLVKTVFSDSGRVTFSKELVVYNLPYF